MKKLNLDLLDKYLLKQLMETFFPGILVFTSLVFASDQFLYLVKQIANYLPHEKLFDRFRRIGWTVEQCEGAQSHYRIYSPSGLCAWTIAVSSWDKKWRQTYNRVNTAYPDMKFLFYPIFIIPENFNPLTGRIEKEEEKIEEITKTISFYSLPKNIEDYEIKSDNEWKKPIDIDYQNNEIMFEDLTVKKIDPNQSLQLREFKRVAKINDIFKKK